MPCCARVNTQGSLALLGGEFEAVLPALKSSVQFSTSSNYLPNSAVPLRVQAPDAMARLTEVLQTGVELAKAGKAVVVTLSQDELAVLPQYGDHLIAAKVPLVVAVVDDNGPFPRKTAAKLIKQAIQEAPAALAGSDLDTPPNTNAKAFLNYHNFYRCMHGASPLAWSDSLASSAQKCAEEMNKGGALKHCASSKENIASTANGMNATGMWYNEVAKYNFSKPGFSKDTGHFTQVVWKGATQIGCGTAGKYSACNYNAGNMSGQFPTNVATRTGSQNTCAAQLKK